MPVKTLSWTVGDKVFATLKQAKVEELLLLVDESQIPSGVSVIRQVIEDLVDNADAVIRILSVKEKKPRSDRGKSHRNSKARDAAVNRELQDMKQ